MIKIRHPDFAQRLETACQECDRCPTEQYRGKQKWIRETLELEKGEEVSPEAVRKWFAGEAKPRPRIMTKLAEILDKDEAWLALGQIPDMTRRERKKRDVVMDGGALFVAGLVQVSGGYTSFPSAGHADQADFVAIIHGRSREVDAPLARKMGDGLYRFTIKRSFRERAVVGVVPHQGFGARLILINKELVERHASARGDYLELDVTADGERYTVGSDRLPAINSLDAIAAS